MPIRYDASNVGKPIPAGEYCLKVGDAKEGVSKSGNPMIETTLVVIEHPQHEGKTFRHWVVFIPPGMPGDKMNVHFRKCIGVPYDGDVEVDPSTWFGKKLRAVVGISMKDGYENNKATKIMPYGETFPEVKPVDEPPF